MLEKISKIFDKITNVPEEHIHDGWFNIKIYFSRTIGNGWMFLLYLISIIYILVKVKDKNKKCLFAIYPILLSFVVFNPVTHYLVDPILDNTYFRLFWLFPVGITIAYAGVDFIYTFSKKYVRLACLIGCITVVMICGKFIYTEANYTKVHNLYKIPDEAKWVTDIIMQDEAEDKYVLAVPEVVPYLRQVNSNIRQLYGRDVAEMYTSWWPTLIKNGDAQKMLPACKEKGVRYLVLYNNVKLNDFTYKYGYHILAQTYSFDVYKYKE